MLSRIDYKGLARRAARQRETAVYSPLARKETLTLERRITSVEQLLESRQALAELAAELPRKLDESLEEKRILSLRDRVASATAELDEALTQAAQTLDPLSFKLRRTRHRGVYRSGRKYVVPFVDTVGITAEGSSRRALRRATSGSPSATKTRFLAVRLDWRTRLADGQRGWAEPACPHQPG